MIKHNKTIDMFTIVKYKNIKHYIIGFVYERLFPAV